MIAFLVLVVLLNVAVLLYDILQELREINFSIKEHSWNSLEQVTKIKNIIGDSSVIRVEEC